MEQFDGRVALTGGAGVAEERARPVPHRGVLRAIRYASLFAALLAAGSLAFASSAEAGIELGSGTSSPAVAYEASTGVTYVAWPAATGTGVDLCVLASGGNECNGGAPYLLSDAPAGAGTAYSDVKVVIEPGGGAVVLARASFVEAKVVPPGYPTVGVIAWSSPAGGAGFAAAGGGLAGSGDLLAPAVGNSVVPAAGAVALGSGELGVFGNAYPYPTTFAGFGLTSLAPTSPPSPDESELFDEGETGADDLAALLNTPTAGRDLLVAVGEDFSKGTLAPCASSLSTGYNFADTTFAGLNEQASWGTGKFKVLACDAKYPVLAAGPSGIGVFEDELQAATNNVDYRAFNISTDEFGAPVDVSQEASHSLADATELSASQDSAGEIYTTWLDGRGLELADSATAGASWGAPVTTGIESASYPVLAGVGGGEAEVAYESGAHEYLEPVSYAALYAAQNPTSGAPAGSATPVGTPVSAPKAKPPATISETVTVDGDNVSLSAPNQCVKNGLVHGEIKVSLPAAKRKGRVVVKIYEVIFKVGGQTLTLKRRHLSNAPFTAVIHIHHVKPASRLVLSAHALIAVKHGPRRSKTLKITLTTCA